jgi:glycosyl transferase family 87
VRVAVVVLAIAAAAFVLLYLLGFPASDYRHNDFAGFWVGSRLLLEGVDPYDPAVFLAAHEQIGSLHRAINPPGIGYGYPLTTAVVFAPFALLPVEVAAPLWLVVQTAAAGLALVSLLRTLSPFLRRDLPVLVALAASSQPAWLLAVGGNLGGYLTAIAAGATVLLLRDRPFAAGALAGLLVVKPHPLLIALPLILLALPRRAAVRFAGGAALVGGTVVVASLIVLPGWVSEFFVSMTRIAGAPVPRATLFGLLGPDRASLAALIVALVLTAFALWVARARPPLAVAIAAAIPLSLFLIPYAWSYDHLALFVTVAVAMSLVARSQPRRRFGVLLVLAAVVVILPWLTYASAFQRGNESLSAVVPLATLGVLALAIRYGAAPSGRPLHT